MADDAPVDDEGAPRRRRKSRRRRLIVEWRRLPKRFVLLVFFCLGALALGLMVVPFGATAPDGVTELKCGPPLFEVIVPPDPDFEVPESTGCYAPARTRLILAGAVFVGLVLLTTITELRGKSSTQDRQAVWLAGGRRRAIMRARRLPPPRRRRPPPRPRPSAASDAERSLPAS